jgi:hypothetical protein
MTTVLAPLGKPRTSPALRLELVALLVATVVVVFGTAMTQEAALVRALRQAGSPALRGAGDVRTTVMLSTALLLVPFYVLHALRRFQRGAGDGLMLAAVMMLCGIGLMTMLSVRDPLRDQLLVLPFARGVFLGGIAAAAAMSTDWERVRSFAYLPLLAAVGLSILLIVFGAGPGRSGVKVNLWGGQPVDVIRLLEVAFIAAYLGSRWEYLRSLQDPDVGRS